MMLATPTAASRDPIARCRPDDGCASEDLREEDEQAASATSPAASVIVDPLPTDSHVRKDRQSTRKQAAVASSLDGKHAAVASSARSFSAAAPGQGKRTNTMCLAETAASVQSSQGRKTRAAFKSQGTDAATQLLSEFFGDVVNELSSRMLKPTLDELHHNAVLAAKLVRDITLMPCSNS